MSEIELPKAPGYFISKWREQGPVDIDMLTMWRDEMNWTTWLPLAEAAMFLDAAELLALIETVLSPAETATLSLVRRRMLGDTRLQPTIEAALDVARHPDTRDLALEGRLRMELGLAKYEAGDSEGAKEDLTWAETRLKSVAQASRDHDLSLINKAALHTACGEPVMALTVYSEIPRNGSHADETIALSRLGASRICAALGHDFDAAKAKAEDLAKARDLHMVPSFHRALVQGVSTYAHELFSEAGALDAVYVPIGLGSGICGVMAARDLLGLKTQVIGVVSERANAYRLSLEAGKPVSTNAANSFAEGIAVRTPHPEALEAIRQGAERVIEVSDDLIAEAMRVLFRATHNVAEGAGAAALAGLMSERDKMANKRIGVILCGGNIDADKFADVLGGNTPVPG